MVFAEPWIIGDADNYRNIDSFITQPLLFSLQSYTPTSFDKTTVDLIVDHQPVSFVIWDTSGIIIS